MNHLGALGSNAEPHPSRTPRPTALTKNLEPSDLETKGDGRRTLNWSMVGETGHWSFQAQLSKANLGVRVLVEKQSTSGGSSY